jgi:nucleoside-diphosphate-sugar epimerase
MSPVLVTGGSGYVGTQLVAALLRGMCDMPGGRRVNRAAVTHGCVLTGNALAADETRGRAAGHRVR